MTSIVCKWPSFRTPVRAQVSLPDVCSHNSGRRNRYQIAAVGRDLFSKCLHVFYRTRMHHSSSFLNDLPNEKPTSTDLSILNFSLQPWCGENFENTAPESAFHFDCDEPCSNGLLGFSESGDFYDNGEPSIAVNSLPSPERIQTCQICQTRFTTKWRLEKHAKDERHKTFECPHQDCDKAYWRRDVCVRHLATHHGSKHMCEHCPLSFPRKDQLSQHICSRHHDACVRCRSAEPGAQQGFCALDQDLFQFDWVWDLPDWVWDLIDYHQRRG
jgi:hypothetical protein